jgi:toxin-antitoxin system PIN domain toxin
VIAVDTNVLVYAHRRDSRFHDEAARAIASLAKGPTNWVLPWPCVHEFFAVVTHPRIYDPPSSPEQALVQIKAWQRSPFIRFVAESPDHLDAVSELVTKADVRGPQIHDARVAAICLEHGVTDLITLDRDFARYPALRTRSLLS